MKERAAVWIKGLQKEQILVFFLLLGLLLVVAIPAKEESSKGQLKQRETRQEKDIEQQGQQSEELTRQLVETLSQVEGVGRVQAAVTLETSGKKVVEKDIPVDQEQAVQKEDGKEEDSKSSSSRETTVYEKDSEGNEIPYVIQETTPEIRGVVVVAQGGGNAVVQRQIQEAVMALFHVEAHKIKVMKMK